MGKQKMQSTFGHTTLPYHPSSEDDMIAWVNHIVGLSVFSDFSP